MSLPDFYPPKYVDNLSDCHPCSIERAMRLIGGKWKGSILWHLREGPVRFNELTRMLRGVSKKVVDQRLKELEKTGMVKRTVICERPMKVSYELTDFGMSALGVLEQLRSWSEDMVQDI
ncbi:helix-turn-helix transcriptional regulator [Aestuariibacter sp. AA17]|uniref:Helix-turn-helix transcriptional regulator n=1 Tax=Fluctibacter corallii TaxID=2984329 RepID=A0ABT3ACF5_9ALTE|nr:helix-turn-helix domain-containing protein [Aestuariibacter sp. AA17]MCV2886373.1 helix-turn-helix transcriptional regulator [Aestuariibacter sp. AA17]